MSRGGFRGDAEVPHEQCAMTGSAPTSLAQLAP